jgi:hypothetical protein
MNFNRFSKNDKRRAPRTDVSLFCTLYQNTIKISGRIKNISSVGAVVLIENFTLNLTELVILNLELDSRFFSISSSIVKIEKNKLFLNFLEKNPQLEAILNIINIGEDLI